MKKYEDYKIKITDDEIYWPPVTVKDEYKEWYYSNLKFYKDGSNFKSRLKKYNKENGN